MITAYGINIMANEGGREGANEGASAIITFVSLLGLSVKKFNLN